MALVVGLAAATAAQCALLPPMTRSEAARSAPCCVTGVVTMASSWRPNSCILAAADDPNGPALYVSGETFQHPDAALEGLDALAAGQVVEVAGETARFSFAPGIKARRIRLLGRAALPPPPERPLRDFDRGLRDNERARLRGVLVEARRGRLGFAEASREPFTRLLVSTPDGLFTAHLPGRPEPWQGLVDAELLLDGCAMSFFNVRAEFLGVQLEVAAPGDVTVAKPPPATPFDLPETPFDEILSPVEGLAGCHRKRVRGVVTYFRPGEFLYLQNGEQTIRVRTRGTAPLRPGDEVDAAGFARMQGSMGELCAATYRPTGRVVPPGEPMALAPDYLAALPAHEDGSPVNYDGRVVRMEGRWVRSEAAGGERRAYVMVGSRLVRVHAAADDARLDDADEWDAFGPNVRVTGVAALTMEAGLPDGRSPELRGVDVYVDGRGDFGVAPVHDELWRRHRRRSALAFAGLALGALAAAFVVFALVRWRLARIDARHLAAVLAERKRMAGDLHDTIEQHLAGARMLLRSAVALNPETPPGVKGAVETASGILAQAKAEIRDTVWNLRSDELFEESPAAVLKSLAKRITATGAVRVRTCLRGLPERLDRRVFADLVFIVQEAVTNAVKHGHAKRILLVADPLGEAGTRKKGLGTRGGQVVPRPFRAEEKIGASAPSPQSLVPNPFSRGPSPFRRSGFVLRVANDGQPFDADKVLGPEAGHFGLSGMRERAVRSGLRIEFEKGARLVTLRIEVKL